MAIDWEHGELPETLDLAFEVEWLRAVVLPTVLQAEATARAAWMLVNHHRDLENVGVRTALMFERMRVSARRAKHHAGLARDLYDRLPSVRNHDESAMLTGELYVRAMDAGLNLAEVVGLMRQPDENEVDALESLGPIPSDDDE